MKTVALALMVVSTLFVQSCSVIKAGKKQTRKDLSVIKIGAHRDNIVHVLGAPRSSLSTESGGYKDIYKIVENAGTKEGKTFAIIGHATMDVVTLGLWEIIGTPLEMATEQEATMFVLYYDSDHKLTGYEAIK